MCTRSRRRIGAAPAGKTRRYPGGAGGNAAELDTGRHSEGTRQQRPRDSRLCRALDRPRRRLFQGARHQQCRADGRPRDAAHLEPAHRQLAASRRMPPRPGAGDDETHGRGRRSCKMPATRTTGRWRHPSTASPSRPPATSFSRARRSRTAIPNRSCIDADRRKRSRMPDVPELRAQPVGHSGTGEDHAAQGQNGNHHRRRHRASAAGMAEAVSLPRAPRVSRCSMSTATAPRPSQASLGKGVVRRLTLRRYR